MKRTVLITTGALGGLGAVLAVTPPQFTQNAAVDLGSTGSTPTQSNEPVASTSPSASASAQTTKKDRKSTRLNSSHT